MSGLMSAVPAPPPFPRGSSNAPMRIHAQSVGSKFHSPFSSLNYNEVGIKPSEVIYAEPVAECCSAPAASIVATVNFSAVVYSHGSFINHQASANARCAGCSFLVHDFISCSSFVSASSLPLSIHGNSASVASASAALSGLLFLHERGHRKVLVICECTDIHYFMVGVATKTKGVRLDVLKAELKNALLLFDTTYCSLVLPGQFLDESLFVSDLSSHFAHHPSCPAIHPSPACPDFIASLLDPMPRLGMSHLKLSLYRVPILSSSVALQCSSCGSPYHVASRCILIGNGSFPRQAIFSRIAPSVPLLFSDSFANPALINWHSAPQKLPNSLFVKFLSSMFIVGILEDHMLDAQLALIRLSELYQYNPVHRQLVLRSPRVDIVDREFCESSSTADKIHAKAANEIRTAALLIEQRHYGKANRFINREQKISVDDPRIDPEVWKSLHPTGPHFDPKAPPFTVPYNHSSNVYYNIERSTIIRIISKWDIELAPGLSGFPASFIIHFSNLTARHETPDNPNIFFSSLVTYIEHFASGLLHKIRFLVLQYKGALLNKNPLGEFKLRNLCMGETFMKLASASLLDMGIAKALACGALSPHDLGCGIPGGVEKFIHSGQLSAASGATLFSLDIKGAYNNVLRSKTWEILQRINCPFLIQWFSFCFGECPMVHYVRDGRKSSKFSRSSVNRNLMSFMLYIGFGQGDNMSGFLYSITQRFYIDDFLFRWLHSNIFYNTILDDGVLHVPPQDLVFLALMVKDLVETLASGNLIINQLKSELFCLVLSQLVLDASVACGSHISCSNSLVVLCRVPIGRAEAVQNYIRINYVPKIERTHERFLYLFDVIQFLRVERYNTFYIFLRTCLVSKCSFWMRCLHPDDSKFILEYVDSVLNSLVLLLFPPSLGPHDHSSDALMSISSSIQELSLSNQGLSLPRGITLAPIAFFASFAESYQYSLAVLSVLRIDIQASMFSNLEAVVASICQHQPAGIAQDFFTLQEDVSVFSIQSKLTAAISLSKRAAILEALPLVIHKQVFRGNNESYSSLPFNSSVRDVTKKSALRDEVFRFAFARRSLFPIFIGHTCKCGALVDPTGGHILVCRESRLFLALHSAVLDAISSWMQAYIKTCRDSPFRLITERGDNGDFHRCWVRHYYLVSKGPPLGKRADAIIFHESDPFRPFVLDVVSIMRTPIACHKSSDASMAESDLSSMLDIAYKKKQDTYRGAHFIPLVKVIPIVIGRSGMIHPSTLLFFDYFICNAHCPPLCQAPTADRLSLLHSIMNALHDTVAVSFRIAHEVEVRKSFLLRFPLESLAANIDGDVLVPVGGSNTF